MALADNIRAEEAKIKSLTTQIVNCKNSFNASLKNQNAKIAADKKKYAALVKQRQAKESELSRCKSGITTVLKATSSTISLIKPL